MRFSRGQPAASVTSSAARVWFTRARAAALSVLLLGLLLPTESTHLGCRTKGGVIPSWPSCRLSLGPGFRLGARWNRLGQAVKTRKKREKTGGKWARYGLKNLNQGS